MKKGLLIGSLAVLLVAGAGVAVVGVGSNGFKNWDTNTWFDDLKNNTDDSTTEEVEFYAVDGSTPEEIITKLAEGKEWIQYDYDSLNEGVNRYNLYLDIFENYNSCIIANSSNSYSIDHLTSGNFQFFERFYSQGSSYQYKALSDLKNETTFDLKSNSYDTLVSWDFERSNTTDVDIFLGSDMRTDKNYLTRSALSHAINYSENRGNNFPHIFYLDTGNFKVIKIVNVSDYYFLPNNLTYKLDFKTATEISSVPSYDADIKEKLGNFFVME